MNEIRTVAVLGAGGMMGRGMAANLLAAGLHVRAWNRTAEKAASLAAQGAQPCGTPAEAANGADAVLTMLSDTDAVFDAMAGPEGAAAAAPAGALWLQSSTIGEAGIERCEQLASAAGMALVDAPVLGTRQPAEEGTLVVLASGPPEHLRRARPVFDAIGSRVIQAGDEPGAATRLKLVANSWILAVVEGVAETFALAEGLGVDPQLFLDAIDGGPLDLPYLRMKGAAIMKRDFAPMFRLALAAKDAGLVEDAAGRRALELPLLAAVRARLDAAAATFGDDDMIATWRLSSPSVA